MIKAKNGLLGKINGGSLKGKLNNAFEHPATETLSVTPTKAAQTHTGLYDTVNVDGSSDLEAANILSGKTIFGVEGSYVPLDTSDANARAGDIATGKTAYVDGEKITGNLHNDYIRIAQDDSERTQILCYIYKAGLTQSEISDINDIFEENDSLVESLMLIAESEIEDIEDTLTSIPVENLETILELCVTAQDFYLYRPNNYDTMKNVHIETTGLSSFTIYNALLGNYPFFVEAELQEEGGITTVVINDIFEFIVPEGTLEITANGTYDVTEYAEVDVDVSSGGGLVFEDGMTMAFWSKEVAAIDTTAMTNGDHFFYNYSKSTFPTMDTSNMTELSYMFYNCSGLTSLNITLDTSKATLFNYMFYNCSSLKTAPTLNTSKAKDMQYMFGNCGNLENLPLYDTSQVTKMYQAFSSSKKLTTTSLDNLLQMCINATNYSQTKTLYALGLRSSYYPAATIQALPHYSAFTTAGWTIGY